MNIAAYNREAQATSLVYIPLRTAYLCLPCRIIMDRVPDGICRICGSVAIWPVGSLILSPDDRQAWLSQLSQPHVRKKENDDGR